MTALSLSIGLAITLVGIPLLVLTLLACRWIARSSAPAPRSWSTTPSTPEPPLEGGVIDRSKALFHDRAALTGPLWSVLLLPIGTAGFTVAMTLWSTALGFVTSPLWYWAMPDDDETIPLLDSTSLGYIAAARPDRPGAAADHDGRLPRARRRPGGSRAVDPGLVAPGMTIQSTM